MLPTLARTELTRIGGGARGRVVLVCLLMVPLLFGVFLVAADWSPTAGVPRLRAAVVNLDRPVTLRLQGRQQLVPMGRQLAGQLIRGNATAATPAAGSTTGFTWVITDAADAAQGLADGGYAAVLTVPANFSAAATSVSGSDPSGARQAVLDVRTDDARSYLVADVARTVSTAASTTLGNQLTSTFLDNVFVGFNDLKANLGSASTGATQLADGAAKLADGAHSASTGADQLRVGLRQLAQGAGAVGQGGTQLSQGASALSGGLYQLSGGLQQLALATSSLPDGSARLDTGARSLAEGAGRLAGGAGALHDELARLYLSSAALPARADQLIAGASAVDAAGSAVRSGAGTVTTGAGNLQQGAVLLDAELTAYRTRIHTLDTWCRLSGASAAYCAQVTAADQALAPLATGTQAIQTGARYLGAATAQLAASAQRTGTAAQQMSTSGRQLAAAAPPLADPLWQSAVAAGDLSYAAAGLAGGSATLAQGTSQLARSAPQLTQGISTAAGGASRLQAGSAQLAAGAAQLSDGTSRLSAGALNAASGADRLAGGTAQLAGGATALSSGAGRLGSGLKEGATKIPGYSARQREQLSAVVANPVITRTGREHAVTSYGAGFAPYAIVLALWVGALATFTVLRPIAGRALATAAASWRIAVAGYLPAAALAVLQATILLGVLELVVGIQARQAGGLFVLTVLVALAYTALNQALVAVAGRVGRLLGLLFLGIQLALAGGLYPLQASSGFFQGVYQVLPLASVVQGLRSLIAGGGSGIGTAVLVLLLWTAGSLALTTLATRRRRRWTPARLAASVAFS